MSHTLSCTESQISLGQRKTYRSMLRRPYSRKRESNSDISKQVSLLCAIKVVNSTVGPNELVTSFLLSGELRRILSTSRSSTSLDVRHQAIKAGREKTWT